jgi:hypothetical protein
VSQFHLDYMYSDGADLVQIGARCYKASGAPAQQFKRLKQAHVDTEQLAWASVCSFRLMVATAAG